MAEVHEEMDPHIKAEWDKADTDKSGSLTFKEVVGLLHKLNLKLKDKDIKKKFKEVDQDGNAQLDYLEFVDFVERLKVRPEIEEIFLKFSDAKTYLMSVEQLVKFLHTIQKEVSADAAYAKKIIAEFEHKVHEKDKVPDHLRLLGFSKFLTSPKYNNVFNPKHAIVYQDMTQPFAHYYIASSHNTYLMGDQLKGESSHEAYINAFKKGCRCVELDCWDGTDKMMPIIYHGHTLTSKITFKQVLETVRDYGFVTTPYPVILSLEVHCSIEGQQGMAALIKEILGGAGLLAEQPDQTGVLPPPEKLKNKVLLKGKMSSFTDAEEEEEEMEEAQQEEMENQPKDKNKLTHSSTKRENKKEDKKEEKKKEEKKKKRKKQKKKRKINKKKKK